MKGWERGRATARWSDGQERGGSGKPTSWLPLGWGGMGVPVCLSGVTVAHVETPGLALMRQKNGGK